MKPFLFGLLMLFFAMLIVNQKAQAQTIEFRGRIMDDAGTAGLKDAVAMIVRLSDSVLIDFTRADASGNFVLKNIQPDTFQLIFSYPKFGDKTYVIIGNKTDTLINFGNIALPLKTVQLSEVTVFGYKSPVYFKGDTLVYTADSFDVKPNAVVEDLLKKLPGIKVDKDGKIFAQGKAVDQVLVDGDEFFGSDPTIATKNLAASSVESVQVYEKKNEDANSESETLQVMNLQLKDDAKKGYFGKITGASDFHEYYEGELLANKFKGKQKISVFSLISNTPRSQFGWEDMWKYGIEDENMQQWEEDGVYYSSWNSNGNGGLPKTIRSGFYYSDQLTKKTKVNVNYTYGESQLETEQDLASQYLFSDTTYYTKVNGNESKRTESNSVSLGLTQKLDSVSELEFSSKFKFGNNSRYYNETDQFITSEKSLYRETSIQNDMQGDKTDINTRLEYSRDFKKKFRSLHLYYGFVYGKSDADGLLYSVNSFTDTAQTDEVTNQKFLKESNSGTHSAGLNYVEPLSKKIKAEINYDFTFNNGNQDKVTLNYFNGEYVNINDSLTNSFESSRMSNRLGLNFIYEMKKFTFRVGVKARRISVENIDNESGETLSQTVNFLLPNATYRYKFSDNTQINIRYTTNSSQPSLTQLQPVPDNSNPNALTIGNPDLLPTFTNSVSVWFNSFKPVTGNSMWTSLNFSSINNNFSNSVYYDSSGRRITQPINVDGNYNTNFYFNYTLPLFHKVIEVSPNVDASYSSNSNYVNGNKNITKNLRYNGGADISIHADPVEFTVGG